MALGDNIKKRREEKNLTQQQLADKLYVSRQTVCRWENGSRCPDLIAAKKLQNKMRLQEIQKKLLSAMEIAGFFYVAITLLFRVQLDMPIPVWITGGFGGTAVILIIINLVIFRKLT